MNIRKGLREIYSRGQKVHIFGATKSMNNDDSVTGLAFRDTSLFVSQESSITESDSW